MRSNVWCAWWRDRFNVDEYIYHYTSFETALKILYSDKFQFSPLSKTNDTTEQKLRISYDFRMTERQKQNSIHFERYWSSWATNSKLLCFSQDRSKDISPVTQNFNDISDVSGRGFALPRMWAQYASNNSGVCFIVRKKPLINKVCKIYPESICQSVSYFDWSESFKIPEKLFTDFTEIVMHNPTTGYATTFLKDNPEFANYSFFSKLKDWEGEKEYRILLPNANEQYLYIEGIRNYLAGIVLGERMDNAEISTLKTILPATIPIRRITFELKRCSVVNVNEIDSFV